ncbi:MAG TPA: hypothetical protein VE127_04010 [Solirubrobacteraceae bacterium]|nr:hypothetical protein [Solirubrobacteraceae bacterium]
MRLISYDPVAHAGFHVNLNVIVAPLPRGMTLRQWMFAGASSALQYAVKLRRVRVGSVTGVHFASTRVQKLGVIPLLTDEYAFARRGHVFLFTYTALASQRAACLPVFTASAKTIRFDF